MVGKIIAILWNDSYFNPAAFGKGDAMIWILCAISFFAGGIIAVFLLSCFAITQQADEQNERIYSLIVEKNAVQ